MGKASAKKVRPRTRCFVFTTAFVVVAGAVLWGLSGAIIFLYSGRIFPGVSVGPIALGGKTPQEARVLLERAVDEWDARGIVVSALGKRMVLTNTMSAVGDLDLTYELFQFDIPTTVSRAMDVGRSQHLVTNMITGVRGFVFADISSPEVHVDRIAVAKTLQTNFRNLEHPANNAHFSIGDGGALTIVGEKVGQTFHYETAVRDVVAAFVNLEHPEVKMTLVEQFPSVGTKDLEQIQPQAEALLRTLPRSISIRRDGQWVASITQEPAIVAPWITVSVGKNNSVALDISNQLKTWLSETVKPYEEQAQEARFVVENDRVTDFQESRPGWKLDEASAAAVLKQALLFGTSSEITIDLERTEPIMTTETVNPLGIKELLGIGNSNFKGSPKNRRHNIAIGAAKLNGIIIPAGEEFSLVTALGKIEAETGYLPELVIKGNKTIPEYGGGLCQIGTTVFRAAMAAGFPILERRNHSYRVRYYEPAGTDATIYPPRPDFRFKNDTRDAVVLLTKILGDDLRFELWGTSDGRKAERTDPKIFNIVKPAATKIIETEDLAPGKKKCTEIAHDGADAVFTYTVTLPDGEKREQVFRSHYKPWQAVCLVGVEKKEVAPEGATPQPAAELPPPPDIPRATQ